jgi:glycosyltransferase involved in cell wall biosynthesis
MISIIIPLFNEEDNIAPLYEKVIAAIDKISESFEIICINDGSTDGTEQKLAALAETDDRLKVISFRHNTGQTSAMMAGIDFAEGEVLIPMDGDLQNDPEDIGPLLKKLDEGYDLVSGWRKDRKDAAIRRNLPSRAANWLISSFSGVHLHDYGCTLKAYRRDVLQGFRLYGEMHRFVPIFADWQGARITEIPVTHHPRIHGQSNYGLERVFKVILDLILVKFLLQFETKPIYVFGIVGFINFLVAFLVGLAAIYLRIFEGISFIQTPLPLLVVMTFVTGVMCILLGLLAELLVRVYYESQGKPTYHIKTTINFKGTT